MKDNTISLLSDILLNNNCNQADIPIIINKMIKVREAKQIYETEQKELRESLFKTIGKDYLIIR